MQGFEGGAVDCLLCGGEEETMRHFVMECGELQEIRRQYGVHGTDTEGRNCYLDWNCLELLILKELLMFMENHCGRKAYFRQMFLCS